MKGTSGVLLDDDYVDEDVAYLLGMLYGRGQLVEKDGTYRVLITLKIRLEKPTAPPDIDPADRNVLEQMNLALENERALNQARSRINNLLDANVDVSARGKEVILSAIMIKPTISWRDLKVLCSNGTDRSTFRLPDSFFDLPRVYHKEFLRGFADVNATPKYSDNAWGRDLRIAFEVVNANEVFAQQLVQLFGALKVPAKLLLGTPEKRGSPKEHRVRVLAGDFLKIGFGFKHKQTLLDVFVAYNRKIQKT